MSDGLSNNFNISVDRTKEILSRLEELNKLHVPLYNEERILREELASINASLFYSFLNGKFFKVFISENNDFLFLRNTKFSPRDLFNNGVEEYHQSFYPIDNVTIHVNDGDVDIVSGDFNLLLKYADEMSLRLDFSEINKKLESLKALINFLEGIENHE